MKRIYHAILGLMLCITASSASAAVIVGSNYAGADLIPANGDVLQGTFTNVGNFRILAGRTVYIQTGTILTVYANNVEIAGILDGNGRGSAGGGVVTSYASNGLAGSGSGPGAGGFFGACVHGTGGGGGAHGGDGGASSRSFVSSPASPAAGGTSYGNSSTLSSIFMGSGGGSGARHCGPSSNYGDPPGVGGNGGGAVYIITSTLSVTGTITVNGDQGGDGLNQQFAGAAGGGGAGGGINIDATSGTITGTLSANGGRGGNAGVSTSMPTSNRYSQSGGGGGGGRIKMSTGICTTGATITANGGARGTGEENPGVNSQAGAIGTISGGISSCGAEINVKGNGVSIVDGDNTPALADHTDFGSVATGETRSFTIENTGAGTLTISSIVSSNSSEFAVSGAPSSVAAGASANFLVTFTPSSLGSTKTATITINNNDADESAYDFALQAFGIPTPPTGSLSNSSATYSLRKANPAYNGSAIRVRRSCDNVTADIGFTECGDLDTNALKAHVFGAPALGALGTSSQAAFSLRKLGCSYSGAAIRVRRGCDNAETDIGFTSNGDLDTTALKNFVFGAGPLNMISTSANVAYSLRRMRCAYSGAAIRVRRSSDNATQDIGFTVSGDLDTAALKTFVGSGNGFVNIWYDQSGNGKNLSQSTASNQPQIVATGVVIRQNGKPTVRFTASSVNTLRFSGTISSGSGAFSVLAISSRTNATLTAGSEMFAWGNNSSPGNRIGLWNDINTGNNCVELLNRAKIGNSTTAGALDLKTWIYTSGNISSGLTGYYNGSAISTTLYGGLDITPNVATAEICMGAVPTTTAHPFDGNVSEVIGFTAALNTTERQTLEYLQSTYYNVSGPSVVSIGSTSADAYVTTWYDQSGNGRNAVQGTNANQPRIMLAGVIERQNSRPALRFLGINQQLATASFTAFSSAACFNGVARVNTNLTYNAILSKTGSGGNANIPAPIDFYNARHVVGNGTSYVFYDVPNSFVASRPLSIWTFRAQSGGTFDGYLNGSLNGASASVGATFSDAGNPLCIGKRSDGVTGLNGWISEILTFSSFPSTADRQYFEYTQALYYGIVGPAYAAPTNAPSGFITTWYDQSGNGKNLTQTVAANQPVIMNSGLIVRHNSKPAMKFDGTDDYLAENTLSFGNTSSFSLVASRNAAGGSGGYQRILTLGATGDQYGYIGTLNGDIATFAGNGSSWNDMTANSAAINLGTSSAPHIISAGFATGGSGLTPYGNGTAQTVKNGTMASSTGFILGGAYNGGSGIDQIWNGSVSDLVCFNSAIRRTGRTLIENDYAQFYGITISNDKYTPADANYFRDMKGIGRESSNDSIQRVRISRGFIIEDDAASGSNFLRDNGDYIMAGQSCDIVPATTALDLSQGVQQRWITSWEVKRTDVGNNGGRVKFIFDYSDYWGNSYAPLAAGSQYVLLKRNTTSGVFDTLNVISKQVSGDQVIFTIDAININTFFTIGTMNPILAPLPVNFVTQKAVWSNENAVVTWTTASESNNSHFIIESSLDGRNWKQTGRVNSLAPAGISETPINYVFTHRNIRPSVNGHILYRIITVSASGSREAGAAMILRNEQNGGQGEVTVYPNPGTGVLNVVVNLSESSDVKVEVWNSLGQRVVDMDAGELPAGSQSLSLNLTSLSEGIYHVRIYEGTKVSNVKVVLLPH